MRFDVSMRALFSPRELIAGHVLKQGATVRFAATTWWQLYTPFVPMDTGYLAQDSVSIDVASDNQSASIDHSAVYARRLYYGEGFDFSKERHPLASAKWDKAAENAGKVDELTRALNAFIS